MKNIRNLILIFLLMFVGLVNTQALDDAENELKQEETIWNEFVEKYEKDLLECYEDLDAEIEVTSTDKSLSVVFNGKEEDEEDNYTLTTNFSYENGILEYDSSWVNKVNEETIFIQ